MKERSPAFQFYPKDWRTSEKVLSMSHRARGIYIDLLCHCWLEGSLPANVPQLAKLLNIRRHVLVSEWSSIETCFVLVDGRLVNKRLEVERSKQLLYRSLQAAKGKASAEARFNRGSGSVQPEGNISSSSPSSSSFPSPVCDLQKEHVQRKALSADADYMTFRDAYPAGRRVGGEKAKSAFRNARKAVALDVMLAALEQHRRSEQWSNPALIPLMTTWLGQQRWVQVLPEPSPFMATGKTAGNAAALQRFLERHS